MALGENLLKNGFITAAQLEQALKEKEQKPAEKIGEIIVRLGFATKEQVEKSL